MPEDNAVAAFAADAPVRVELAVDDQVHTTTSVRSGTVLAAVTGTTRPPAGFNSRPLGAMRHLAAASPAYVARHFALGIGAGSLSRAPCLIFNAKDDLQARWVRRLCHRDVELPRYAVPSAHAFVTAALAGMGRGLHPHELIAPLLANGSLVALVPDTALDVPLYWQHARAASSLSGSGSAAGGAAPLAVAPAGAAAVNVPVVVIVVPVRQAMAARQPPLPPRLSAPPPGRATEPMPRCPARCRAHRSRDCQWVS